MTSTEYQQLVDYLGRQFAAIDGRFVAIDERFDAMDQRFVAIDERFDAMDQRFVAIDRRFDAIDGRFATLDERFVAIDGRFAGLERRMDSLEERVSDGFRDILGHFDEIYRRLERFEQEYYAVTQALRRIEALLVDEVGRREMLERSLETIKRDVASLQARIEGIEARLRR